MNHHIKLIQNAKKSYNSIGSTNFKYLHYIIREWFTHLPYIKPYYAVKSFPNKDLIRYLALNKSSSSLGISSNCNGYNDIGFDCASQHEISLVKRYKKPIIFANPVKSIEDIIYARKCKVKTLVVDSVEECEKVKKYYPEAGIVIRVLSDEMFSQIKFNKKFGASLYSEVGDILYSIKQNRLRFMGYSFHVGSKCNNMIAYKNTIDSILNYHYHSQTQSISKTYHPKIIDIGGGFENIEQIVALSEIMSPIVKENNHIKFIAEPGRLFSYSILDVYVKVIGVRKKIIDNIETYYVTVNDSIYHTFNGKIFDGQHFQPIPLYNHKNHQITERCIIFGNTCDSLDIINDGMMVVPRLGDIILFRNMGSYSLASSNGNFNGFQSCKLIK
jgi:ornithine decarboxylase